MTDDLDRRMDARIAGVLRKVVHEFEINGRYMLADCMLKVADALDPPEPALKPCPFCGAAAERNGPRVGCTNNKCNMEGWHSIEFWNRRVEVPHG